MMLQLTRRHVSGAMRLASAEAGAAKQLRHVALQALLHLACQINDEGLQILPATLRAEDVNHVKPCLLS